MYYCHIHTQRNKSNHGGSDGEVEVDGTHHLRVLRLWTRQLSNRCRCIWKRSDAWSDVLDPNPPPCGDIRSRVIVRLCAHYGHVCQEGDTGLSPILQGHAMQHAGTEELRAQARSRMRKASCPGPCHRVPILYISIGSVHDRHVIGNAAAVLELHASDEDRGSTRHLPHKSHRCARPG